MAPVPARSGKQGGGHGRLPCPPCLRHTCVEWAAAAIRPAFGAQGSAQPHRAQGKAHHAAVRALAFKWIRLRLRCGQDRTPDNASVSLPALQSRGASLRQTLVQEA